MRIRSFRSFLLLFVSTVGVFAGCMSDPITEPEVRSRVIFPPGPATVGFKASGFDGVNSGSLTIIWSPSPSDTQANFHRYFVKLYRSIADTGLNPNPDELQSLIDSQWTPGKGDTSVLFRNIPIGRYTSVVWSQRYTDPAVDTPVYSKDSLVTSFNFDPRPVSNPTNLRAVSINQGGVRLYYDRAANSASLAGYYVYIEDPAVLKDSAKLAAKKPIFNGVDTGASYVELQLPQLSTQSGLPPEKKWRMWMVAVRNDSTQSTDDTTSIIWAGAEPITGVTVQDTAFIGDLLIGNINGRWGITASSQANLRLDNVNGQLRISGVGGTLLHPNISDTAYTINDIAYARPFAESEFTETSVDLPGTVSSTGVLVYARVKAEDGLRYTRLFIERQSNGTLFDAGGRVHMRASFQPGKDDHGYLPYF